MTVAKMTSRVKGKRNDRTRPAGCEGDITIPTLSAFLEVLGLTWSCCVVCFMGLSTETFCVYDGKDKKTVSDSGRCWGISF